MDQQTIIGIIELSSIIIAGGLGIAGAITDTKDKKGKLTKWGIIAVAGIILSNSFSFIQSYLQQQKERREEIENYEKQRIQDSTDRVKYFEQMQLLYANIQKSDSSLKQQFKIQAQTSNVLEEMDKSMNVQKNILEHSQELNQQQKIAVTKIDQTLNPIFPLKMFLRIKVKHDDNTTELNLLTNLLKSKFRSFSAEELSKEGINKLGGPGNKFYISSTALKLYSSQISRFKFQFSFSKKINNVNSTVQCEIAEGFLKDSNNLQNMEVIYDLDENTYFFVLNDVPVRVTEEEGISFNSTKELEGTVGKFILREAPGLVNEWVLQFKFPPDFSRISYLKLNGSGSNTFSKENFSYTYTYITNASTFIY